MKSITIFILMSICVMKCNAQEGCKQSTQHQVDSSLYVRKLFLWYDTYSEPNKWVLEEKDIDEVYNENPEWIIKYFPSILEIEDLPFYIKANISCYLYLEGEKSFLNKIIANKGINEEEKRVLNMYLRNFKIELNEEYPDK